LFGRRHGSSVTRDAVQPELALKKITPLRNDLSDADLEVVERKPKQKLGMGNLEPAGEEWTRLTARFFNPTTGTVVESRIATRKNPAVIEISSPTDLANFLERERVNESELVGQM
jgi:hypothetical protein